MSFLKSGVTVLLQSPAVLLLDELTSFLDEGDQRSVLAAVRAAVDSEGVTAVWVSCRACRESEQILCSMIGG